MISYIFIRLRNAVFVVATLSLGLMACTMVDPSGQDKGNNQGTAVQKKMFVCSMHPNVIQDKPGDCPLCGMALIEKTALDGNSADLALNDVVLPVNEAVLSSVETVGVTRADFPVNIEASGIITYDPRNVTTVSARYGGLIEKSYIKYRFQPIRKGEKIFDIYCPEIYVTHMNYVNLLKALPDNPDVTYDARAWLTQLGLTDQQIRDLIRDEKPNFHLSVYSEAEGFVVGTDFNPESEFTFEGNVNDVAATTSQGNFGIGLSEGGVVETGEPLFKVVSLEFVRADLKIRTEDAGMLRVGQHVILTDAVLPESRMDVTISQIEPLNGGLFQVVRAYIPNQGTRLYPGMKIQAQIQTGSRNSMWVPKGAVVDLGQSQAVFLQRDTLFIATAVKTGLRSGDQIEVCSGLDENSRIAANASLLTDSDGFIKISSR
jgi:membrane fusion protein, copper/silver efflux system